MPSAISSKSRTASKAHWFAQVLFQDTNDDRIDLNLFEDAIYQIAKLTSDTGRRSGLIVSALDSGASGPCSSPDREHCVVLLGKTPYS